ncbi:MAG: hypothetical protein ACR2NU_12365, partial [Aeoliella sp.]
MTNIPQNPNRDEWSDRLVDRALEETVGGQSPSDLSEQILAAAEADVHSSTGELTMATEPTSKSFSLRSWVLAASVIINVGLAAMLLGRGGAEPIIAQNESESVGQPVVEKPSDSNADGKDTEYEELIDSIEPTVSADGFGGVMSEGRHRPENLQTQTVEDGVANSPGFASGLDVRNRHDSFELAGEVMEDAPTPSEPPVAYPDADTWQDQTALRARYKAVELARGGKQIATGIELKTVDKSRQLYAL